MTIAWRTPVASRIMPDARRVSGVLADEGVDRRLLALDGSRADALRHDVEHHDLRAEALREVAADPHRQLGVRPATDRHEDRSHLAEAALLDDGDVARRLAHDRVDGGREDRPRQHPLAGEDHLGGLRLGPRGLRRRRRTAPAEDDQVAALLPDRLDHPIGCMAADADQRPQLDPLLVAEIEHALEKPARGPRLGCALREADPLGHLDDAEGGDLGRPAVGHAGTDADEVARRPRVRERQEDAIRGPAPGRRHQLPAPSARADRHRATR